SSPNMLLVRADSPFKTVADVVTAAREKPGQLSYGYAGNGTSPHLAAELLKYMTKVDITPVPYKGGAPGLADLLGGHIPLSFNNIPESIGQVQAGKLRPIAVTTATRSPVLPDVPTIAETGLPGYDTGVWWGFLARPDCRPTSRRSSPRTSPRPCMSVRCASGCSRSAPRRSAARRTTLPG